MNISFESVLSYPMQLVNTVLPRLTDQQKRIVAVASLAFACMAACYTLYRFCCASVMKANVINQKEQKIQSALLQIRSLPDDPTGYYQLGTLLSREEKRVLSDGIEMSQKDLYLKALELEPTHADSYKSLAGLLGEGKVIRLPNGNELNREQLYIKAIEHNPLDADAYLQLALILPPNQNVQLADGSDVGKQALLIKVINLNPNHPQAYYLLAQSLDKDLTVRLAPNGPLLKRRDLYQKHEALGLEDSAEVLRGIYLGLAQDMEEEESIPLRCGNVTKRQLDLKHYEVCLKRVKELTEWIDQVEDVYPAIELAAKEAMQKELKENTLKGLAYLLLPEETASLPDGTKIGLREVLLESIQLNPGENWHYFKLASNLSPVENVTLLDGTVMTKKTLYLKAIELNPLDAASYNNLSLLLSSDESIRLPGGEATTAQGLLLKAVQLMPGMAMVYCNLGKTLPQADGVIQLHSGIMMTKRQLFLKSIELDPFYFAAYRALGRTLQPGEKNIRLNNGVILTREQLLS